MSGIAGIRTVGVVGTGVIGSSWITLFLAKGLRVLVSDPAPGSQSKLTSYIAREWSTMEKLGLSPGASQSNFEFVDDVAEHLDKVDFVQENGPESLPFKTKLFARLDAKAPSSVIIASSSSGIPSSKFITNCTKSPSRILIGHPFNPPHLIPLVEVVPHPSSDDSIVSAATDFYRGLGKQPILLRQETPGFVANRLQAALNNEAFALVSRGVVSGADIDAAVTTGLGLRWALTGPLMTNVLGGGGGKAGFQHLLEHIGPAAKSWTEDMEQHKFKWSETETKTLTDEVDKIVDGLDGQEQKFEEQRDEVLIKILHEKGKANLLS